MSTRKKANNTDRKVTFSLNGKITYSKLSSLKVSGKNDLVIQAISNDLYGSVIKQNNDFISVKIGSIKDETTFNPIYLDLGLIKNICKGRDELIFTIKKSISVKSKSPGFSVAGVPFSYYSNNALSYSISGMDELPVNKGCSILKKEYSKLPIKEYFGLRVHKSSINWYSISKHFVLRIKENCSESKEYNIMSEPDIINYIDNNSRFYINNSKAIIVGDNSIISSSLVTNGKYDPSNVDRIIDSTNLPLVKLDNRNNDITNLIGAVSGLSNDSVVLSFEKNRVLCSIKKYDSMEMQDIVSLSNNPEVHAAIKLNSKSIIAALKILLSYSKTIKIFVNTKEITVLKLEAKGISVVIPTQI